MSGHIDRTERCAGSNTGALTASSPTDARLACAGCGVHQEDPTAGAPSEGVRALVGRVAAAPSATRQAVVGPTHPPLRTCPPGGRVAPENGEP